MAGIKGTGDIKCIEGINHSIEQIQLFSKTRKGVLTVLKAVQPSQENAELYEQVVHATNEEIKNPKIDILKDVKEIDLDKRLQEALGIINEYATLEQDTQKVLRTAQLKNNPLQQYVSRLMEHEPSLPHDKQQVQEGIDRLKEAINRIEPLDSEVLFKVAEADLADTQVPQRSPEVLLMLQLLLKTKDYLLQELINRRDTLKQRLNEIEERKENSMNQDKYLPIGSVVMLQRGHKEIMIYGRAQRDTVTEKEYDYVACLYPEGYFKPEAIFLFNHEHIDKIVFMGYNSEENVELTNKIRDEIAERKQNLNNVHHGFENI